MLKLKVTVTVGLTFFVSSFVFLLLYTLRKKVTKLCEYVRARVFL